MPIWLYRIIYDGDVVPRLQAVDFSGEKKFSIVTSNFAGQLFYLQNTGTATVPNFQPTQDLPSLEIATHKDGVLWCNYLSPFLYDWSGTGRLDLTMGDGSYSANSIFLLKNTGSNDRPVFNEDNMTKIIPGMGREHLTPQVVDWNNDGKPDIIAGERQGYVDVYLNQAAEKGAPPVFDMDKPLHVMFGMTEKAGAYTTVCVADLNHDNLFDLVVGGVDGRILYSLNIGTPGAPKFGPLVPFKGVYPYKKVILPFSWVADRLRPYGYPGQVFECVNAQTDADFLPLPDSKLKGAGKFSTLDFQNVYFKSPYIPQPANGNTVGNGDMTKGISYPSVITLQVGVRYIFSYWAHTTGDISDIMWHMEGNQLVGQGQGELMQRYYNGSPGGSGGSSWAKVTQDIRIESELTEKKDNKPELATFKFYIFFKGNGTLYLNNISLKKVE